ncbi:MAG: isopentenyl phosphate kinase [Thermoplasmata archaeon]
MLIIKIGGSVITDKNQYKKLKIDNLENIINELPKKDFILIHGAGSFGHYLSEIHNLNGGILNNEKYFSIVSKDVLELNNIILDKLIENGINSISLPIHSFHMVGSEFNANLFEKYLRLNFIPVTFGDIILNPKTGLSICSGDQIAFHLSKYFRPEKVIFVTDVDGIYDRDPRIEGARLIEEIKGNDNISFGKRGNDVTGGMENKFRVINGIVKLGIPVYVLNGNEKGRLFNAIYDKEFVGTKVMP